MSWLQIITSGNFTVNDHIAKELTEMARNGIQLLSNWTTSVMEMVFVCLCLSVCMYFCMCICKYGLYTEVSKY